VIVNPSSIRLFVLDNLPFSYYKIKPISTQLGGVLLNPIKLLTNKENPMKLRPLHDRVLVQRIEAEDTVKGGIIIPDTAKEKPQEGVVIAVGNGKILENGTRLEMSLQAGDHILFGKYAGTEVKIDGEEYLILREEDVLAITEGAGKAKSSSK
jgi:chaperonin GroES